MDQTSSSPSSPLSANTLHRALELSKKSWLLAIQFPDQEQPSLYAIEGGDAEKLTAKLTFITGLLGQGERCFADDHALLRSGL